MRTKRKSEAELEADEFFATVPVRKKKLMHVHQLKAAYITMQRLYSFWCPGCKSGWCDTEWGHTDVIYCMHCGEKLAVEDVHCSGRGNI